MGWPPQRWSRLRVRKGDNVTQNCGELATGLASSLVKALENRGALQARRPGHQRVCPWLGGGTIKVSAAQQGFDIFEGWRFQVHLGRPFTNPQTFGVFGIQWSRWWASLPWIQCIRRCILVLLPLKKRAC